MRQSFVTLVMPFEAQREQPVLEVLARLHQPVAAGAVAFALLPAITEALDEIGALHFMSINVVPPAGAAAVAGRPKPARLLIELTADGSAQHAVHALCKRLEQPLRELLDSAALGHGEPLATFLLRHHCAVGEGYFDTAGLNFSGSPEMTVERIRSEAALAAWIEPLLQLPRAGTAFETLSTLRDKLWQESPKAWAKWVFEGKPVADEPATRSIPLAVLKSLPSAFTTLLWPLLVPPVVVAGVATWLGSPLAAVVLVPAVFGAEVWLGYCVYQKLRTLEQRDIPNDDDPDVGVLEKVLQREDRAAQNHLFIRSTMKPGYLRRVALKAMYFGIRSAAMHYFPPGHLSNIGSIHFARWILLPGSDDLIFCSNYSGSWESYLEDFIQRATNGLTGVWSNTEGFPRTENLVQKGASDGARFKRWARRQQYPTAFWYSAYPTLSNERIRKNAQIRAAFATARDEREAARWLAHFGGPTPPAQEPSSSDPLADFVERLVAPQVADTCGALEVDQITTLAVGSLGKLQRSMCVLYRFEGPTQDRKAWLQRMFEKATYGDARNATDAVVLGLTAEGLRALGLSEQELGGFPVAFQHGSALRARAIGDVGDEAAEHWAWGSANNAVHAVVLFYVPEPPDGASSRLREFVREVVGGVAGAVEVYRMPTRLVRNAAGSFTEPFGFADGISQPFIKGTRPGRPNQHADQCIEPGEMILGYPDGLGFLPPSPGVSEGAAAKKYLPLRSDGMRDLGHNGTFLVVRQLEQNVQGFDALLDRAGQLATDADAVPKGVAAREWIGAKLIGRWKNGSALVRSPLEPAATRPGRDETFRFGAEDPDGLRCPYGSHVRRANPRESFEPGSQRRQAVTNRHRLLRVGRRYRSEQGTEGIMFMCLNADFERQFEFVQQTWVRGPSFHGLRCEVDPIFSGPASADDTVVTIPTIDGPLHIPGPTPRLVTLRGSGYFFLPSKRALRYLAER